MIFGPEFCIIGFTSLFLLSCFFRLEPWWTIFLRLSRCLNGQKPESEFLKDKADGRNENAVNSWSQTKSNVAAFALQGRRPKMEDRFSIIDDEVTGTRLCGIFDGHGGQFAVDFVEKSLFKSMMVRLLKTALSGVDEDFEDILRGSIVGLDEQMLEIVKLNPGLTGGTTCLVSLIHDRTLYIANVGDSRAVICDKNGEAIALTDDHKPQQLSERERIKKAGGFISFHGVWRVGGVLATSRALGDFELKRRNLIVADPDVFKHELDELEPRFMIMATDGLWDCMSNQDVVDFLKDKLDDRLLGAEALVNQAFEQGATDNITALIIDFRTKSTAFEKELNSEQGHT